MFEKVVQYFVDRFNPPPIDHVVDGRSYKVEPGPDGPSLGDLISPPETPTLALRTLTGFVDAFKAGIDQFPAEVAVLVADHLTVQLVSMRADEYGRRQRYLNAVCCEKNPFPFDEFVAPEKFLLSLQSGFLPTEDVISLQRLASSLTSENSVGTADDGLSQVITVKQGTVTRESVQLPPRIPLFAYRTFREIDPVSSEFLVRLKGEPGKLPSIGLLQIDAEKWKWDTMRVMSKWLIAALPAGTIVIA